MSKRVSVTLDKAGIDSILKELDVIGKTLEKAGDEIASKLADTAVSEAQTHYKYATSVGKNRIGDGYAVTASGKEVVFDEFGTGYGTDFGHDWAGEVPVDVSPGSWSENHSQQFSKHGYWYYDHQRLTGQQANRGLLRGMRKAESEVRKVAEEVFK